MNVSQVLFLIGLILLIGCNTSQPTEEATDNSLDIGLDMVRINLLIDSIESEAYPNRHSLLIYKNDSLVVEEYFPGEDEIWGEKIGFVQHTDTVLHDMRSVSKSVVSACIGIAIDIGLIKSTDQSVFDFFEDYQQYKNDGRENITIRDLLTMTAGLEWNENVPYTNPENSEIQMDESPDKVDFILSRKMVTTPGTEWNYSGGTTEILAEIIHKVSGKNVHEFAKEYVFSPIGITRSEWTTFPGSEMPAAASGLRLTSPDLLKFAILYHNKGLYNGKQIIPAAWIEESLTSHIDRPRGGGYGYQFWTYNLKDSNGEHVIPAAVGNGDQRIFFDSENDMVIVTTAGNYNQWDIEKNSWSILKNIHTSIK